MCLALRNVHSQHIMHRDLKSANVFLHQDTTSKICLLGDFGVGKSLENTLGAANTQIGTPSTMSPEIYRN